MSQKRELTVDQIIDAQKIIERLKLLESARASVARGGERYGVRIKVEVDHNQAIAIGFDTDPECYRGADGALNGQQLGLELIDRARAQILRRLDSLGIKVAA